MKLANKIAIVTGSGSGIGRAIALRLAEDGADVVVADLREETLAAVGDEVRQLGRRALTLAVDVTDPQQVRGMVEKTVETFGRVDILVNDAGGSTLYPRPGETASDPALSRLPTDELSVEYWRRIIDLNLTSTFLCTQAVIGVMKRQGAGRIINLASIVGRAGKPLASGVAYSSAKGGIIAFTRHVANELASSGITVNAIAPGIVLTERLERVYMSNKEWAAQQLKDIPMGRGASPAEQAAVVAFLASEDASYVTGAVIDVNGGWFMG